MRLRKYYISLWPNNQHPISYGTVKAENIKIAKYAVKQALKKDKDALKIFRVTSRDITISW